MNNESRHGMYFIMLLILMISTFILSTPLILFFVSMPNIVSYIITALLAYLLGHISAGFIERITHKEKKEVLAGTIIPLPTVIGISIFVIFANLFSQITTLNSIIISLVYFISFNTPFLIYFYEHERHKHHLIGLLFAPMALAVAYTLTFLITSIIGSYSLSYGVEETSMSATEHTAVYNYVNDCIKLVAQQKISQGFSDEVDLESYIDSNLNNCIDDFKAFKDQPYYIKTSTVTSDVTIGDSTIAIKVYYPIKIIGIDKERDISKFGVILKK